MAALQTAPSSNIFFSKYLHSLSQTPHRLRKRMLATWTSDQELNQVRLRFGVDMKRKLGWYVLSNAAVARSFTDYLCCAFGQNHDSWRVEVHGFMKGFNMLDFPAVAIILLLTLCLCHRHDLFLPQH